MTAARKLIIALAAVVLLAASSWWGWYYFKQTLRLSQLVEGQNDPYITVAANLFDFDTGLTRYDLATLRSKGKRWRALIEQIERMSDQQQREFASAQLYAEILQEPAAKKALKFVAPFGNEAVLVFLRALGE